MKKLAILLLVILLLFVDGSYAYALKEDDITEPLLWDDVKVYFDYPNGDGRFEYFFQAGFMLYLYNSYKQQALSRQEMNEGILGYYLDTVVNEPAGVEVTFKRLGIRSRDDYEPIIKASGGTDLLYVTINGKPAIIYNQNDLNSLCVAFVENYFGDVTVFRFFPVSHVGFEYEIQQLVCSIQPIDTGMK